MKSIIRGRMVRINKQSEIERNGEKIPVIYFTVADRSQTARKNADGSTSYLTKGFYFCKAYGKKAELILRDFGQTDENGKLISRALYIEAEPQFYKGKKEVPVSMVVPAAKLMEAFGMDPSVAGTRSIELKKTEIVETQETVYLVKEFEYDDAKPKSLVDSLVSLTLTEEAPLELNLEGLPDDVVVDDDLV